MKERLAEILTLELFAILVGLWFFGMLFMWVLSGRLNLSRRKLLGGLLRDAIFSGFAFSLFFLSYRFFPGLVTLSDPRVHLYLGFASLFTGAWFFVKVCKVIVFEYLFISSLREGVPVLLVNIVTLITSLFLVAWMLTTVFGVRLAPLLATSALLSVVLGLALQDTLGNLFAGVALQFDKPFEIGDWIEVYTEKELFTGQVHEITWRATVIIGLFDEVQTIPNRLMAQSQITNFSGRMKPIYRGVTVHVDPKADENAVRQIFTKTLKLIPGILQTERHYVMLRELNEKGAMWRIVYPVEDFGNQFTVVDLLLDAIQTQFKSAGIELGRFRLDSRKFETIV